MTDALPLLPDPPIPAPRDSLEMHLCRLIVKWVPRVQQAAALTELDELLKAARIKGPS